MDFTQAKKLFARYLNQYDGKDEKIRLKIVHTYGVVKAADYITAGLELSSEDAELARHIALLHDIGRFKQLKLYNSFDDSIIPHAKLSLEILFKDLLIEQFLPERDFDSIIYSAIENHGLYQMDSSLTGRALLHAQIIRDADKLDNFRVKELDSIEAMLDISPDALGKEPVSDHAFQCFLNHIPILNSERKTHMDMWVSYLGYIFDLNFTVSRRYVLDNDYINKLADRIPYSNEETKSRMEEIRKTALSYLSGQA